MPERFALFPSKRTTRLGLWLGIVLFVPAYAYGMRLVSSEIGAASLAGLLSCFDPAAFGAALRDIGLRGGLGALTTVYALNIASALGYFLAFASLSLIIARGLKPGSLPRKAAWIFPPLIACMAALDLFASVLFLILPRGEGGIPAWMPYAIDAAYLCRLAILYPVLAWLLVAGALLAFKAARKKKGSSGSAGRSD